MGAVSPVVGGTIGFPYTEVYSAAKGGLIAFTRVLRADYRKKGVSSSIVILGPIGGAGIGVRRISLRWVRRRRELLRGGLWVG